MIRRRSPRFYKGIFREIFKNIFSDTFLIGVYVKEFEEAFANYIGVRFAVSTCSGRNALDILLAAYKLKDGDEILIPGYTLKDLVFLIESKGIKPKPVDIEADTFNVNPDLIEAGITGSTKAILATHLFGMPCNIEKIVAIANKHKLIVIEDCAHSLGAGINGRKVGSFGHAGFFSFEVIKPINTFGGGMITTNDPNISSYAKDKTLSYPLNRTGLVKKILFTFLENMLIESPLYPALLYFLMNKTTSKIISSLYLSAHSRTRVEYSGYTNMQALMGLLQLGNLEKLNNKRISIAQRLNEKINTAAVTPESGPGIRHIYYFYVLKIPTINNMDEIRMALFKSGIDTGIRGEITDDCSSIVKGGGNLSVTKETYGYSLQLPMHDNLNEAQIDYIAKKVNDIMAAQEAKSIS